MEAVYQQFEQFDFSSEDFQNGLLNVFESYLDGLNADKQEQVQEITTEIPEEDRARLTMQAKTFYFCSQTGEIMNIEDYEQWKAEKAEKVAENKDEEEDNVEDSGYSSNYQELVELILQGKEVPGIKQIPDTVLEGESSEHTAKQRVKPWEKKVEEDTPVEEEK